MSERFHIRDVAIFSAGTHRGKLFTLADLDDMVENFRRFSAGKKRPGEPGLKVPAVLGHEENQEYLARTDLPAAAWPSYLRRKGRYLYADFEDVPRKVARLLQNRAYRTVSAEVYDAPPPGIPGRGRMLRRVAFLGGDIPQIKDLGDLPDVEEHSEGARFDPGRFVVLGSSRAQEVTAKQRYWVAFSEVKTMNREEMIAALAKKGVDTAVLGDAVPDAALAEMLRALGEKPGPDEKKPAFTEELDAEKMSDWPEPKDETEKAKYRERAAKLHKFAKRHAEKYCGKMGELEIKHKNKPDEEPVKLSESGLRDLIRKALADEADQTIGRLRKFAEEEEATRKKNAVEAVITRLDTEGRLPPVEKESVRQRLLRADARRVVEKFAEKGATVELTEFDLQVRELEARPTLFAEKFRDHPASKATGKEARKEWALATYEKFSEAFDLTGVTRDTLVENAEKATDREFQEMKREWDGLPAR